MAHLAWTLLVPATAPAAPFAQYDWPNPVLAKTNPDLRGWLQSPTPAPNPIPPAQRDWPNPQIPRRSIDLSTWVWSIPPAAVVAPPFSQTDWPNPVIARANYELRGWIQSPTPTPQAIPFLQTDWPNPVWPQPSLDLKSWFQTVALPSVTPPVPPVITEVPAGRKRYRDIYRVTVDGQKFEFRSLDAALQFLAKAKAAAEVLAAKAAREATELQSRTAERIPAPKLAPPKIGVSSRELRKAAAETKREIVVIYQAAAMNAEIAMLMELTKRDEDNDDALMLLM